MSKRTRMSQLDKVFDEAGDHEAFVGLDVHKRTIHAAVWLEGRVAAGWVMPPDTASVAAMLAPYSERITRVVYEAGPTGYGLARALDQAGLVVEVVAPGRSPRPAVREQKCDRLDAERLAEYAAKDLLVAVAVPSETQEADRQLMRIREQLACKRRRIKQQIKSFLLQHGVAEPPGLTRWSRVAVAGSVPS